MVKCIRCGKTAILLTKIEHILLEGNEVLGEGKFCSNSCIRKYMEENVTIYRIHIVKRISWRIA